MRAFGTVLIVALIAGLCLDAGAALALEWDQEKVTEIATRLHEEIKRLRADPGISPAQDTAFQERRHAAALATLQTMQRDTGRLVSDAARGRRTRLDPVGLRRPRG